MATFTANKIIGPQHAMASIGDGQSVKAMVCSYSWTTALLINDLILSALLPRGCVVHDVSIVTSSMGTGAVTIDVGYGLDPDYFIAASTIGVAGGIARASAVTAHPLTLTENDTIDVLIKVAPTGATASGTISMVVRYMPLNS